MEKGIDLKSDGSLPEDTPVTGNYLNELLDKALTQDDDGTVRQLTNKERSTLLKTFPTEETADNNLATWFFQMATTIMWACPDSRERSLSLTNLEQSMMWALKSIKKQ